VIDMTDAYVRWRAERDRKKVAEEPREEPAKPSEPIRVKTDTLSETARVRVRNAFKRFWNDKRN
jgi:hypothetical protein